jgi:23S rRNA (cytidine1920-2'-O)/16S rRNA (cytidine1409-2'-O)-methyltransferase
LKSKERLDTILVERDFYTSKEKARAAVMAGLVVVNGQKVDKPGQKYPPDIQIETKGNAIPYVSRGGIKLARALEFFKIPVVGRICMDVGASTGGFTDCLLQHGAVKVYAVDVGYGQLDWKLRSDPRVVVWERTNIRYVTSEQILERIDLAVIDVSFISLTKVIPTVLDLLAANGAIVCLIKPQFEAGREAVGKKGVVRDPTAHMRCLDSLFAFFADLSLSVLGLTYSPVTGPEGNIEFLAHLAPHPKDESQPRDTATLIHNVVTEAHKVLK